MGELTSKEVAAKVKELSRLRDKIKSLEGNIKDLKFEADLLAVELDEHFLAAGIDSIRVDGRLAYRHTTLRASASNPEVLFEELRKAGHGDLVKETVNAQSLSAFAREEYSAFQEKSLADFREVHPDAPAEEYPGTTLEAFQTSLGEMGASMSLFEQHEIRVRK